MHYDAMVRLAFLLGADDSEGVAQEAFVRLHIHMDRLRSADSAAGFVRACVVNLTRSRLRHLLVSRRLRQPSSFPVQSAEDTVIGNYERQHIRSCVASLSRRQREVVVLRYWMCLREAEIAETLGIAPGTVKATASRALARLAQDIIKESR